MKTGMIQICLFVFLTLFSACGGSAGGSEFGNPSRPVIGTVVDGGGGSALKKETGDSCPADTVIAVDSLGNTTTAEIDSVCDFEFDLTPGKAYVLSFTRGGVFVAFLVVQNSSATLESTIFYLADGEDPVHLGEILIADGKGRPANEPARQNDRDGNGRNDYDDDDDDGDGISDDDEEDCDLDGFLDDDDEDQSDCGSDEEEDGDDETGGEGDILQVDPRNGENNVNLTEEIEVRFDCTIDSSTVTAVTFRVESGGDSISCEFESSDSELSCEHEDDPFQAETTYTVTVNGVACESGNPVETKSWSFTTREEED
ncbi:MAG: Ig-like domain-containing protein [Deltaproteobacteria bacterium]|nr:Ig-like domain-containing protein [Deltaproteobacteria bacterium]